MFYVVVVAVVVVVKVVHEMSDVALSDVADISFQFGTAAHLGRTLHFLLIKTLCM
jgi:hypothetical protein